MTQLKSVALISLLCIAISKTAYAYVDPGSGSLLIQLLIAMSVGVMFYFRTIRDKLKKLVGFGKGPSGGSEDADDRESREGR